MRILFSSKYHNSGFAMARHKLWALIQRSLDELTESLLCVLYLPRIHAIEAHRLDCLDLKSNTEHASATPKSSRASLVITCRALRQTRQLSVGSAAPDIASC